MNKSKIKNIYKLVYSVILVALLYLLLIALFTNLWTYSLMINGLVSLIFIINLFLNRSDVRDIRIKIFWSLFLLLPILGIWFFLGFGDNINFKYKDFKENEFLIKYKDTSNFKEDNIQNSKLRELYLFAKNNTEREIVPVFPSKTTGYDEMWYLFKQLLFDINTANRTIYINMYILKDDWLSNNIVDLLIQKAKWIDVYLIVDSFGIFSTSKEIFKKIKKSHIELMEFNKIILKVPHAAVNYRNHKKYIVIDENIVYNGGFNFGKEYISFSKKYPKWHDFGVRQVGQIAHTYIFDFIETWNTFADKRNIKEFKMLDSLALNYFDTFKLIDGPNEKTSLIYNTYKKLIDEAKEQIIIATPYISIPKELEKLLYKKSKDGVKIIFIVPGKSDNKPYAYKLLNSYLRDFVDNGITVLKLKDTFVHDKFMLIDKELAVYGTANFDYRSFFINFELCEVTVNNDIIENIKNVLINIEKNIELITKENINKKGNKGSKIFRFIKSVC